MFHRIPLRAAAALLLTLATVSSQAQTDWPAKPVRIIVPFAAGGSTDLVARQVGQLLQKKTGQAVIVENRAGAGGLLGAQYAKTQPADGYTLLLGTVSTHSVAPSVYAKMPYDPLKDFEPLTLIASVPNLVVVNPARVKAGTLSEFAQVAKVQPQGFSFGSSGKGSSNHLATESLMTTLGSRAVHVPYKGSGPALLDTMAGNVDFMLDVVMTSTQYVKNGQLKALAVTSRQRIALLPDVPTVAESGYPGFEAIGWFALFAPAGTPVAVRDRVAAELAGIVKSKDMVAYLESQGAIASGIAGEAFRKYIVDDTAHWKRVADAAGVKAE
jgi:tripartite-type tricarboxylate transporter receptor subunit TctC